MLSIKLTNGTNINLGNIKGSDGIGIKRSEINSDGHLVLTYSDNTTADLGNIVGTKGSDGSDGIGISDVDILTDGTLTVSFSDGTSKSLGNIKGEKGEPGEKGADGSKGEKGDTGRGIVKTETVGNKLAITYTDGTIEYIELPNGTDNTCFNFNRLEDGTLEISINPTYKTIVENIIIPSNFMV